MEKIHSIAVTGKGGTGKTVVATLLIRLLAERYPGRVLAIDADSAMSLPYTLDLKVEKTVSQIRKEVMGAGQLQGEDAARPTKELMRDILTKGPGFDLLTMGRPEEPGCFCAVNELLRFGIDMLSNDYEVCVIDGEAGPEQINRRVLRSIDALLVVSDMSARSLKTAAGIVQVANKEEDGIDVKKAGLVLNRVREDTPEDKYLEEVGIEVFGKLPEDPVLNKMDREGKSLMELPEDSPCLLAVKEILEILRPSAEDDA